ncbi:MAG: hypothetical protein PHU71_05020 [Candidatus Gracilibacteria bacterium]|nr:hypothetical protein [Candidatus Gracilibacteria bacterium]
MSVENISKIEMDHLPWGQGIEESQKASASLIALLGSIQESVLKDHPELASEQREAIRSLDMGGPSGWGGC